MPHPYKVPVFNRLMRAILRPVFRTLFHLLAKVKIEGKENIPAQGPYLIAMNHVSLFDPPFMLAFWPVIPEAAGAVELWSRPGQNILVRLYGGIQVHRGQIDRQLIEKMLAALEAGHPLLIAPEGGRSHVPGLRKGLPGVAYLQEITGVEVIPVGIVGATDDFFQQGIRLKRPTLVMRIGKPLRLPPIQEKGEARRLARQRNVDEIMRQIAALLPPEYRGVYAATDQDLESPGSSETEVESQRVGPVS